MSEPVTAPIFRPAISARLKSVGVSLKVVSKALDRNEARLFLIAGAFCKNPVALIDSRGRLHQRKEVY